jgi:hypothetical protein
MCSKKKFNNKGMTLVELIATFALLSLFTVAAANIIFKTMSVYYQARGTSYGMQVSQLVASKIVGMVEGAQNVTSLEYTDDISNVDIVYDTAVLITDQDTGEARLDSIDFTDETGSRVCITTKSEEGKNYLCIHYYPVADGAKKYDEAADRYYYEEQLYKAVDWEFDNKAYLGYSIKSLTFEKPEGFPGNVIKLGLTVVSDKYGEYSTTKYIELYNFTEEDYQKLR